MILSDEVSGKIDRVCCGAVKIFMGNKSSPFCTFLQDRVCAAMKAPVGLLSHKAVLRKQDGVASPRQTWGSPDTAPQLCHGGSGFRRSPCRGFRFSGATWLDLSNLVARTEYHSRLVLSTLIFRFFSQNRCTAGISALFLHSAQRKPFALEENPLVFYCILKWFLLL